MTGVAIGLAVLGAVCFAVAAYLQHDAVHRDPLARAVRRPRWLVGLGLIGLGATVHAAALALAPLVVVQPIGVLALPLVAALHARAYRLRLGAAARLAIGATAVGVAAFVAVAATATAPVAPPMSDYARAALLASLAVAALAALGALSPGHRTAAPRQPAPGKVPPASSGDAAVRASRVAVRARSAAGRAERVARGGRWRCLAYAAAAGVAYALVSVLVRAVGQQLGSGGGLTAIPLAVPLGIGAALAAGGLLVQLGYASGPPAVVVACLTIVDPLVSVGVGIGVLGETSASVWTVPVGAVCALLAVAGTVALARHHPDATTPTRTAPATPAALAASTEPTAPAESGTGADVEGSSRTEEEISCT